MINQPEKSSIILAKEIQEKINRLTAKNPLKGQKAIDLVNDFVDFCAKCLKIKTKEGKILPFILNDAQANFARQVFERLAAGKPARFIILKARQLGFSTVTEAIIYYLTSTQEAKNGFIVAQDSKASDNLFEMFKTYYELVPDLYKPMRKKNNSRKLTFENPTSLESQKKKNPGLKSQITVDSAEANVLARSGTIHFLHISELAFWPENKKSKHMLALLQSLSDAAGTVCIIESTANGIGEYYQQMWEKAEKGENDYIPIFVAWHEFPTYRESFSTEVERQEFIASLEKEEIELQKRFNLDLEQLKWRRSTIKNKCEGSPQLFAQEYPSFPEEAFLVSGRSVYDQKQIQQDLSQAPEPIRKELDGAVWIWEEPIDGELYDMGCDVAEGLDQDENDASTYVIWKRSTGEQVAEIEIWEEPYSFAAILNEWARYYNHALLGVERNNHGHAVLLALIHIHDYPNLYAHRDYDSKGNAEKREGWPTTGKTRPMLVEEFRQAYANKEVTVQSKRMLGQMRTFVKRNGKAQHQEGCHDDILFGGMIGWEMRKHPHAGTFQRSFKANWFQWWSKHDITHQNGTWYFLDEPMSLYQGVHAAVTQKQAEDDFSIVTIGLTPSQKVIILDPFHDQTDFTDKPRLIISKYQEWAPERVGINADDYQTTLKQQIVKDAYVPVKQLQHSNTDQFARILTIAPLIENGQVYLRKALEGEPGYTDISRLPGFLIHEKFKKIYLQLVTFGPKITKIDVVNAMQCAIQIAKPTYNENHLYK